MAAPVLLPLVPVAKPLTVAGAAKAGAVLRGLIRNGPTLLRMMDQFRAPPSLGPAVADAPRRERLQDLVADAIAGAQLGVASLPNPMQPQGPGGEWLRFALASLAPFPLAGNLIDQIWGLFNGDRAGDPPPPAEMPADGTAIAQWVGRPGEWGWIIEQQNLPPLFDTPGVDNTKSVASLTVYGVPVPVEGPEIRVLVNYTDGTFQDTCAYFLQSLGRCSRFTASSTFQVVVRVRPPGGQTFEPIPPDVVFGDGSSSGPVDNEIEPLPFGDLFDPAEVFAGLPSAAVPLPSESPEIRELIERAEALVADPLPAVGAVVVPSNPPRDWFTGIGVSGVPAVPGSTPGTLPGVVPQPLPLPAVVPRPLPGPSPSETQPETEPEIAPGVPLPGVLPGVQPAPPPTKSPGVVPVPGPVAPPLTDSGVLPAPAPVPAPVTDAGAHFPVPGAPPVVGEAVRPDLQSIAREVGRIEEKTARILKNQSDEQGQGINLGPIKADLADLVMALLGVRPGGTYQAVGVCEVDAEGNHLNPQPVVTVPFSGSLNTIDAVGNKVDAIAQLLQEHKQLRQPICRPPKATGEPVTVVFEDLGHD